MEAEVYQGLWQQGAFCKLATLIDADELLPFKSRLIWKAKLSLRMPSQREDLSLHFIDSFVSGAAIFLAQEASGLEDETVRSIISELSAWLDDQPALSPSQAEALANYAEKSFALVQFLFHRWAKPEGLELITPGYLWQMDERDPWRHGYQNHLQKLAQDLPCLRAYTEASIWQAMRDQVPSEAMLPEPLKSSTAFKLKYSPLWEQTDPYQSLGLRPGCSKVEVMSAMMQRIRDEPQHMSRWRKAQNEIFTPAKALRWHFFNHPVLGEIRPSPEARGPGPRITQHSNSDSIRDAKEWVSHV